MNLKKRSRRDMSKEKVKFKKPACAPRRFRSAFMFYSASRHKEIRKLEEGKKLRAADIAKMVSKSWKELSPESRAEYEKMARDDKVRYEREKANYKGPWKVAQITQKKGRPKKPMSAFLAFGNERRGSIVEAHPSLSNAEISSLLSQLWRDCEPHIKQIYRDREVAERKLFKQDLHEWEQSLQQHQQPYESNKNSSLTPVTSQAVAFDDLDLDGWNSGEYDDGIFDEDNYDEGTLDESTTNAVPAMSKLDSHTVTRPKQKKSTKDKFLQTLLDNEVFFEDFSPLDSPWTAPFVHHGTGILPGRDSPLAGILLLGDEE